MHRTLGSIVVLLFAAGCASTGRTKAADAVGSVTTVDQELSQAQAQLEKTLGTLGTLLESKDADLAATFDRYSDELSELDGKVHHLRDRTTAMAALRDAYLQHWLAQTVQIQDAGMKLQAEQRRTELMTQYMELNTRGAALKKAYAPVHAGLHDCRRFLEADLNPTGVKAIAGELEKIRLAAKDLAAVAREYREGLKKIVDRLSIPAPEKK